MKLVELIDTDSRVSKTDSDHEYVFRGNFKPPQNSIGSGASAYAMDRGDTDPGTIDRIQINPASDQYQDGFSAYADALVSNNIIGKSPYAPRIYKIDKEIDPDGKYKNKWQVEKLHHLSELSNEQAFIMFAKKMYKDNFQRNLLKKIEYATKRQDDSSLPLELSRLISEPLEYVINGRLPMSIIGDHDLSELLSIVMDTKQKTGAFADVNTSNLMVRYTSVGPQLVLTDPLI